VEEADEVLIAVIQRELEDGREFLAAKGLQAASPSIHGPDHVGGWSLSIAVRGDQDSHVRGELLVEIDPARVGWHVEATASVYQEGVDRGDDVDVGRVRITKPGDPDSWARVLVRRAYVTLWQDMTRQPAAIPGR
jgi:hypothetical protein